MTWAIKQGPVLRRALHLGSCSPIAIFRVLIIFKQGALILYWAPKIMIPGLTIRNQEMSILKSGFKPDLTGSELQISMQGRVLTGQSREPMVVATFGGF